MYNNYDYRDNSTILDVFPNFIRCLSREGYNISSNETIPDFVKNNNFLFYDDLYYDVKHYNRSQEYDYFRFSSFLRSCDKGEIIYNYHPDNESLFRTIIILNNAALERRYTTDHRYSAFNLSSLDPPSGKMFSSCVFDYIVNFSRRSEEYLLSEYCGDDVPGNDNMFLLYIPANTNHVHQCNDYTVYPDGYPTRVYVITDSSYNAFLTRFNLINFAMDIVITKSLCDNSPNPPYISTYVIPEEVVEYLNFRCDNHEKCIFHLYQGAKECISEGPLLFQNCYIPEYLKQLETKTQISTQLLNATLGALSTTTTAVVTALGVDNQTNSSRYITDYNNDSFIESNSSIYLTYDNDSFIGNSSYNSTSTSNGGLPMLGLLSLAGVCIAGAFLIKKFLCTTRRRSGFDGAEPVPVPTYVHNESPRYSFSDSGTDVHNESPRYSFSDSESEELRRVTTQHT